MNPLMPQKGFTHIELLIVIALFAILFGISIPELRSFYASKQVDQIRLQLLQMIHFAHEEAQIQDRTVAIGKRKKNWSDGQIVFIDENRNGKISDPRNILFVNNEIHYGSLFYRSFPYYRDYLEFHPNGTSDNGTLWFCDNNTKSPLFAIFISRSGKTRCVYPDKKQLIHDPNGHVLQCMPAI